MGMTSLSIEILEHISAFVDRPGDLLALALTSHTFAAIIIPNHLEYSYIRADPRRQVVWKHLIENPHLAARVHTLELIDEMDVFPFYPVVPKALWTPRGAKWFQNLDPTPLLCQAIAKMSNLKTFRWLHTKPSHSTLDVVAGACRQLSGLEVACRIPIYDQGLLDKWYKFGNLKQFSYSGGKVQWDIPNTDIDICHERLKAFQQLQHQCPYLEDLQLDFQENTGASFFKQLFQDHHWPKLRRLNIQAAILHSMDYEGRKIVPIPDLYNLETLRLTKIEGYVVVFSRVLKLRSLEIDYLMEIPPHIIENLASLSLTIPRTELNKNDPRDLFHRLAPILDRCTNLRSLVINSYIRFEDALSCILRACPAKLERLAYNGPLSFINIDELVKVEGQMCNLTHIALINQTTYRKGPNNVRTFLAASAPRLKFIGWRFLDGEYLWEKLERGELGSVEEVRELDEKSYQDDIVIKNWGGHYLGACRVRLNPNNRM